MTHNLFITSTRQNDGKTVLTVGLTRLLSKKLGNIGFMKPLGRSDFSAGDLRMDEDAALIAHICNIHENLQDMSPITLGGGVPVGHMTPAENKHNRQRVMEAYKTISANHDFMIIEGTGHAGVGSAFGLSNGWLAAQMKCKVLLVSSGGVAQPIDEIMLNKAFFESHGAQIAGVVINKVYPKEFELLHEHTEKTLRRENIPILGMIPYEKKLNTPTVLQAFHAVGGKLLHGDTQRLERQIKTLAVGAMTAPNAVKHFQDGMLLVAPGDRSDLLLALVSASLSGAIGAIPGIVLTGGFAPEENVLHMIKAADIPLMQTRENSFEAAKRVDRALVRISPRDTQKINTIEKMVREHVAINQLLKHLEE